MNQDDLSELVTAYIQLYTGVDIHSDNSRYDKDFNLIDKSKEKFEWASEEVIDLSIDSSELLWDFVLEVLRRKPPIEVLGMLAAGALEDFFCKWAVEKIDLIEQEARLNPDFRKLLCGVWQSSVPDDIWKRIIKHRDDIGWERLITSH